MSDDALALLDGTVPVLREVAKTLTGHARFAVLLSANAIETSQRALALRDRCEAARRALPQDPAAIRSGAHDGDVALYDDLVAHAALRAWIADPASVTEAERAAHVDGKTA